VENPVEKPLKACKHKEFTGLKRYLVKSRKSLNPKKLKLSHWH
jgi:hypothetical protein